jgi:hypothetical protein
VAGIGNILGIVDGILVAPTGGIAITSFAVSVMATVITSFDIGRQP